MYDKLLELTILGQPPRKSNQRQIVRAGNKLRVIKSKEALEYVDSFISQVPDSVKVFAGSLEQPLAIEVIVYYASNRPDLSIELVKDCLEKAGVIKNDRYIKEEHVYGYIDKENPRAEIILYKIMYDRKPPFTLTFK